VNTLTWLIACGILSVGAIAQVDIGTGWDRAAGRPAWASSTWGDNVAGNAVDASTYTAWNSLESRGFLWVDLGARMRIVAIGQDLSLPTKIGASTDLIGFGSEGWHVASTVLSTTTCAGLLADTTVELNCRSVGLQSSGYIQTGNRSSWKDERASLSTFKAYQAGWRPKKGAADVRLQDFCLFQHGGKMYIASMMKDYCSQGIIIGRSDDLWHWNEIGKAVTTRTAEDACMVWAPHVVEDAGVCYMFYTGVTCPQSGAWCQRILVATTTDPDNPSTWQRNTSVQFDVAGTIQSWFRPSHAGAVWTDSGWADCRDPMVMKHGDTWYLFYSGRDAGFGICGVATAPDILGPWVDHGAVLKTPDPTIPESCFVLEDPDGTFVMTLNHAAGGGGIKIARSGSLLPVAGQPSFQNMEILSSSTVPGLAGWAHEFLPGIPAPAGVWAMSTPANACSLEEEDWIKVRFPRTQEGGLLAAYLTGYYVNLQDARFVKEPLGWTIGGCPDSLPSTTLGIAPEQWSD